MIFEVIQVSRWLKGATAEQGGKEQKNYKDATHRLGLLLLFPISHQPSLK
jgi:hypothetical protein